MGDVASFRGLISSGSLYACVVGVSWNPLVGCREIGVCSICWDDGCIVLLIQMSRPPLADRLKASSGKFLLELHEYLN